MPTLTVPYADLTTEQVVTVLRDGLGPRYNVLPGMAMGQLAFQGPKEGRPDAIAVGTGGNRLFKAQVTIRPRGGRTELRVTPGGATLFMLINTFGIARKIRRVLANSPSLSTL